MALEIIPSGAAKTVDIEALIAVLQALSKTEDAAHTSGDKGIMLLGLRSDTDASTADDGDYTMLKLDEQGRLKVSTKPASYPDVTGDITATQATINPVSTTAGATVEADVSRASNVMMFCRGTFSTINCSFEGSLEAAGSDNWFSVQAIRSNANTIETTTGNLSAMPAYAWELSVNGLKRVRVRCTARTSGTQSWRFVLGTYATEPIPGAQVTATQAISGTVTATLAASTAVYADTTTVLAGNAIYTGTARDAAATPGYQRFIAFVTASHDSAANGLEIQASADNTTWFTIKSQSYTANSLVLIEAPIITRYIRIRFTNGTTLQTTFRINSCIQRV